MGRLELEPKYGNRQQGWRQLGEDKDKNDTQLEKTFKKQFHIMHTDFLNLFSKLVNNSQYLSDAQQEAHKEKDRIMLYLPVCMSYCIYRMLYDYFPGSQTVIRRERDVLTFKILSIVHAELVGFVPSSAFSDSKLERILC